MVKVGAIIQVRLGSERLPGKALLPLPFSGNTSLLEHVVTNARAAKSLQQTIIATTTRSGDDTIETFCSSREIPCVRGSADDVLDRFRQAAHTYELDVIVRLTGDNPFVMPEMIDLAVEKLLQTASDYIITTGLPLGTNVEVFTHEALEKAATLATATADREHVTPYIRREAGFKNQTLHFESDITQLRLTVDYPTDYALAALLFERLWKLGKLITHEAISTLLREQPWVQEINAANSQRQVFVTEEEEISAARQLLQAGGFTRALRKL
ncbi:MULTISPECIES: cytidylyltransferase domain-containing protein [Pontibacter]|uniref:Spore coat polysaccharide biosynthesis protein SpsF n=1 Tax=Pontibacter lucknowensis TaxID=1077936 RepID=A0A1N7AUV6_9BACT|nr:MULTISPECIES: glycosyltransferase family protein [Pontibacter]EJF10519.1 class III aminotransferase [Pontibacter sp. BAB1700]SIR42900.1 spore coat polysaccharide biosynthesis protein SpsF [Pontibacter lucknowensis]